MQENNLLNKISLFFIIIPFLILCISCSPKKEAFCKDCNIILIDIDSLRVDHLGCYGYDKNTSPNIDKLAEKSFVFENFFIESSHTTLSKMSVYTSLYPYKHKVRPIIESGFRELDHTILTLPQILSQTGYTTVWVGPMASMSLSFGFGFDRGFDYFIEGGYYDHYDWNDGIDWIKENKEKKFFISFYSEITHDPYSPNNYTLAKFTNRTDVEIIDIVYILKEGRERVINKPNLVFNESFINENNEIFMNKSKLNASLDALCYNLSIQHYRCSDLYRNIFWDRFNPENASDIEALNALYDAVIYEADQNIKGLIKVLEDEQLFDKTIIIFYSDHGDEFWEHNGTNHGDHLYDEVIHVPLIIYIPEIENKEVNELAQGVDIMPTILDLIGVKVPAQSKGKSLLPVILKETSVRYFALSQTVFGTYSLRSMNWKYITNFEGIEELYNLKEDPYEKNNLANEKSNVKLLMKDKLNEYLIS